MADNRPEPSLLGLPTELIAMIGEHVAAAKDLGILRATCLDLALRLYPVIASRICINVTIDAAGVTNLEALTKSSSSPRLLPMANYITRIRLADLGLSNGINVFWRDDATGIDELKMLQATGKMERQYDADNKFTYAGYHPAGPACGFMMDAANAVQPTVRELDVWRVAKALEKYPALNAIGVFLQRSEVDVLQNHDKPFALPIPGDVIDDGHWHTDALPPTDEWASTYHIRKYATSFKTLEPYHDHYESALVRPAFFDLSRLDRQLLSGHKLSKSLQRLTIGSWPISMRDQSGWEDEGKLDVVVRFIRSLEALSRLRVILAHSWEDFSGKGLQPEELIQILSPGALPHLTHVRIEGGMWLSDSYVRFLQTRGSTLKFFYLSSSWYSVGRTDELTPFFELCKRIDRVFINLGHMGCEQFKEGLGFEKLRQRMHHRLDRDFARGQWLYFINDGGPQWGSARLPDDMVDPDAGSWEEPQSEVERQHEFLTHFAATEFD